MLTRNQRWCTVSILGAKLHAGSDPVMHQSTSITSVGIQRPESMGLDDCSEAAAL